LWAQAVAEAGTDDIAAVLKAVRNQSMSAPEGIISIDGPTLHTWRPVYIGRIRGDGQFDIVWTSERSVRPIPYPTSRTQTSWDGLLDELHRSWGGWANPGQAPRTEPAPARKGRE
jgi:urea transport system substrate-binding protein